MCCSVALNHRGKTNLNQPFNGYETGSSDIHNANLALALADPWGGRTRRPHPPNGRGPMILYAPNAKFPQFNRQECFYHLNCIFKKLYEHKISSKIVLNNCHII